MERLFFDRSIGIPYYLTIKEDLIQAEKEFNEKFTHGNALLNSRTVYDSKESRITGLLGEIVFRKLYNVPPATPEQDLTFDYECQGFKVDVKCKLRNYKPKLYYEASVYQYQTGDNFHADMYYFMSTTYEMDKVWLCGYCSKDHFLNSPQTRYWKAGQIDSSNNLKFLKDSISMEYKHLTQVNKTLILK